MKWLLGLLILVYAVHGYGRQGFYGGKVETFARHADIIAWHEHYGKGSERVSRLRFIDLATGATTAVVADTPKFSTILWTEGGEYLIGISMIFDFNEPQLMLYSNDGQVVDSKIIDCNSQKARGWLYCSWRKDLWLVNNKVAKIKLKYGQDSIAVCTEKVCHSLSLNNKGNED
jgi:hypothetical protein